MFEDLPFDEDTVLSPKERTKTIEHKTTSWHEDRYRDGGQKYVPIDCDTLLES